MKHHLLSLLSSLGGVNEGLNLCQLNRMGCFKKVCRKRWASAPECVVPSGKLTELIMENHHFQWEIQYKWPFSIAMLNYQRVGFNWDGASNFERNFGNRCSNIFPTFPRCSFPPILGMPNPVARGQEYWLDSAQCISCQQGWHEPKSYAHMIFHHSGHKENRWFLVKPQITDVLKNGFKQ